MTQIVRPHEIVSVRNVGNPLETRRSDQPGPASLDIEVDPLADRLELLTIWEQFKEKYAHRQIPTTINAWRIPDCIIVPPHMLLVTSDGRLVAESVRKKSIALAHSSFASLYAGGEQDPLTFSSSKESVFLLGAAQSRNYYHWMVESLPRLDWTGLAGAHPFIVDRKVLPFHNESLELLNSHSNPFRYLRTPTCFREVLFVEQLGPTNTRLSPLVADFYRRNHKRSGARNKRILVSRCDAGTRRIDNEPELIAALSPLGFELLIPSDFSVEAQARLFAEAEVVIGAHGAGLTNIAFCQPDTLVVEIIPDSFSEGVTSYAAMAELFGLKYIGYIGKAVQAERAGSADICVTPQAVCRLF